MLSQKLTMVTFFFAFLFLGSNINAQNWQWVTKNGSAGNEKHEMLVTDASGNSYTAGWFDNTLVFGSTTLIPVGSRDIFVVKYNTSGTVQWALSAGGSDLDYVNAISIDASGNCYIIGNYSKGTNLTFGTTVLNGTSSPSDSYLSFVAKCSASGSWLWAKEIYGTDPTGVGWPAIINGYGLITDASANVYITGSFTRQIHLDTLNFVALGGSDIFLAKYDANGNVLWAKKEGGTTNETCLHIALDNSGNIYVSGEFDSPTTYIGSTTLTSKGSRDMFVAKFDGNGIAQWAKSAGTKTFDDVEDIIIDGSNDVLICGNAGDTLFFGNDTVKSKGFLAKYNNNGTELWVVSIFSGEDMLPSEVITDVNGNYYVSGSEKSAFYYLFVIKYDNYGNQLWSVRYELAGGMGTGINGLGRDASGNIYAAGTFYNSTGGTTTIGKDTLICDGYYDAFIAKMGDTASTWVNQLFSSDFLISVFPSPGNGIFYFKSEIKISNIEIINVLGTKVFSRAVNSGQETVNLLSQPNGIYFLKIKTEQGIANKKLIIQK